MERFTLSIRTLLALICLGSFYSEALCTIYFGDLPLVGTDDNNSQDKLDDVLAVVDAYNTAKDPDITRDIMLFKKTDDDASFVFNATNGFSFYADMNRTVPVTSDAGLHNLDTAYFSYSGPETIEYYSVKAGKGFSLYEFDSSKMNLLTRDDVSKDISHVSFWTSTSTAAIPEASSFVIWGLIGLVGVCVNRRIQK